MKWVEPVKSIILTCLGRVLPFWGRGQGEDAKTILTTLWMAFLRNKKRFQHLLIIFIQPVLCKVPKSHTWVKVNVLEWLRHIPRLHTAPKTATKGEERRKGGRRWEREGERVSGREREGVTDRLSGCTGISSTQRHMILRSEVILTDEYRAESRLPHKRKGVVFTPWVWKVYFRNPSCQHETVNLSQGRRVTSTNITLFFFFFSNGFIGLPKHLETLLLIQTHLWV